MKFSRWILAAAVAVPLIFARQNPAQAQSANSKSPHISLQGEHFLTVIANEDQSEIDLANPKSNMKTHGFTPEERAGFTAFVQAGFLDTFREFEKGPQHYTWWSQMSNARARNVGWRIDYFLISPSLRPRLKRAAILPHVLGSDHCPVVIELA